VEPGNSGGPFVLPGGKVAGLIFGASVTNDDVGYAITSPTLIPLVDRATGRTDEVGTGRCVG
jgi:S1-C subfamily serine protease